MFNPRDPRSMSRLCGAIRWSRLRLEPFRRNNYMMQAEILGAHYSWSASPKPQPVNMLRLAYDILLRQLVSKAPRSMSTPSSPQMKPVAADFDAWMEHAAEHMKLLSALRTCAANALTCLGVMKIGTCKVDDHTMQDGTEVEIGQPFCLPVSLDAWVHDMSATSYQHCKFAGDLIEVPLDAAKEDKSFDKDVRESLQAAPARVYGEFGEPLTRSLSAGTQNTYGDDIEDVCQLWNIWLPRERLIVTIPYMNSSTGVAYGEKPLRVVEWDEPKQGPYRLLSFGEIPDNVMPMGPLQSLVDLNDLLNQVWRKLARQARRQKRITGFRGQAKEDAALANRAQDGEAVLIQHPELVAEINMGGMPPEMVVFAQQIQQLISYIAGNLDVQGGLSQQAQTLGQEELLSKSSSAQVAELQDRMTEFTRYVMEDVARHWWEEPSLHYRTSRPGPGDMDVPVSITPQMRQQPFEQLRWDIAPYSSMQNETPQTRLSGFLQILNQVVMPMMPMLQSQGFQLKGDAVLEIIGRYGNYPDLQSVLIQGPPPDQQPGQQMAGGLAQQQAHMPAQTTRTNRRVNVPGQTDRSQTQMLAQMMAGARGPNGQNTGR